jgi:hypothetical protein
MMTDRERQEIEAEAWNKAIDALSERIYRYYWDYKGAPQPCAVAYHVKVIAGEMKIKPKENTSDER